MDSQIDYLDYFLQYQYNDKDTIGGIFYWNINGISKKIQIVNDLLNNY